MPSEPGAGVIAVPDDVRRRQGAEPTLSRWRPSRRRTVWLLAGAWLFGVGEGLVVGAGLGNSPWTVFAEGAAGRTGTTVGLMTNMIGILVLLLWIPLHQRPGLGTVTMVFVVGTSMDVTLACLPELNALFLRLCVMTGGIVIIGVGTGFYLGSALGPGPRDGLMTGLHRVTGQSLALTRGVVEFSVLAMGAALGGTIGVGTVVYAVLIGPVVNRSVSILSRVPTEQL
jgi:uncharacterized membrane protein YczE